MGWCLATTSDCQWPRSGMASDTTSATLRLVSSALRAKRWWRCLSRYQAQMPATTKEPVMTPPARVWK